MGRKLLVLIAALSLLATGCSSSTEETAAPSDQPAPAPRVLSLAAVDAAPPGGLDGTVVGHWQHYFSTHTFDYRYDIVFDPSGTVFAAAYTLLPFGPPEEPDTTMIGTWEGDVVRVADASGFWTDQDNFRARPLSPGSTFAVRVQETGGAPMLMTNGFIRHTDPAHTGDLDVPWCPSSAPRDDCYW